MKPFFNLFKLFDQVQGERVELMKEVAADKVFIFIFKYSSSLKL